MLLKKIGSSLELSEVCTPTPSSEQILIQVSACAVCRTDLHIFDGELHSPKLPLILGHEIVGRVKELGSNVQGFSVGDRIGVPWLGFTCGHCQYCHIGQENLCDSPKFTGYTIDGGFAEYTVADANYCFPIPETYSHVEAAPLLCAGLIGYRAYNMTSEGNRIGLYGFGAAAHIIIQLATAQGKSVYVFTKPGDTSGKQFATTLGAHWVGDSTTPPPDELDSAIIFAPVGDLVPAALKVLRKGGRVVCAGIHMSEIPAFPYEILWGERSICSVANLTRNDGLEFFKIASQFKIKTSTAAYALENANLALNDLREGKVEGAAVLEIHCG